MSVGLKDANPCQDDVAREIHDKYNVLVGQMVVNHECLKRRLHSQHCQNMP